MKSNSKNELIKLLSMCGQIAEHKSEKFIENNMDEEKLISVLSSEEKETLKSILLKLKNHWIEEHKKHHSQNKEE